MLESGDLSAAAKVLAATREGWIAMTPQGRIADLNPAAERMLGWSRAEILGRSLVDVVVPERVRPAHRRELERHHATGESHVLGRTLEMGALHRDGSEFPVEVVIGVIADEDPVQYHAFVRDISERRRLGRYVEAERAVSAFLVGLGPRAPLLGPLTSIIADAVGCERGVLWTQGPDGGAPVPEHVYGRTAGAGGERLNGAAFGPDPLTEAWSGGEPLFRRSAVSTPTGAAGPSACGLWLPITVTGVVVAVAEFTTHDSRRLDPSAAQRLGALAARVGHILEQRSTARKILTLNERNQRILDGSSDGILGLDGAGRVNFVNPAAALALRADSSTLAGRFVHDAVHGDLDHARKSCPLERAVRAGSTARFDGDSFITAAEAIVVDASCAPAAALEGDAGAVLTFRDVTERRALEDARARDLAFLQTVLDSMGDGVVACDAHGHLTLFNRRMEAVAGRPSLPVPPERWAEAYGLRDPVSGELMALDRLPLSRALRGEVVRGAELLITDPAGMPRLVTINSRQLRDPQGRAIGAVDIVHDVTDERAVAQRMAEAERLGLMGAWELELDSNAVFWSPGMFWILGLKPGSVEPTHERWRDAMHPDDRAAQTDALSGALAGGATQWHSEYRIRRSDGEVRYLRSVSLLERRSDGTPLRLLGTVQDCTDQALAEAALARNKARTHQAERMESLGQLAGGVAHDFNNLLAVILGSTEFMLEDGTDPSPMREDVQEIRKAAQRAADLTRRLLVFSRREVVRPQRVDLLELVGGLEDLLRRTLGEDLDIVVDLPETAHPVSADFGQLEQVVINLALNARDAMPDGGVVRIDVTDIEVPSPAADAQLEPGRYVRLRVSDTGTGMPPGVASRVFDPFFTTKPKGSGTGLGLATVYGAVSEAHGSISVSSTPGLGSTFTVLLPEAADEPEPAEDLAAPSLEPADGTGQRVLVVEDDASVLRVVHRILSQAGYTVLEAPHAQAAISLLEQCADRVALLLTDVVMPGTSGWELHTEVRERWPRIPTLLMSGYADDLVCRRELGGPGVEFIAKPFVGSELLGAVALQARPAVPR